MQNDSLDPAVHSDLAHEKLAAIESKSLPIMVGLQQTVQHLADAARVAFGTHVSVAAVDNAAVDAAQAAAIARTHGDDPLAFALAQREVAGLPTTPGDEDPEAPKCGKCFHVADSPVHYDKRDANVHDFVPPAAS